MDPNTFALLFGVAVGTFVGPIISGIAALFYAAAHMVKRLKSARRGD